MNKGNNFTPWSYRKGSTILHRLPAGLKLAFLLILSLVAIFCDNGFHGLIILSIIAFVLIILSIIAKIGPLALLRGSAPLFFLILAVFIFQAVDFFPLGINFEGLKETVVFCFRIGAAFAAGTLLFSVTTSGEIRKSLEKAETLLHLKKIKLALSISLMLSFLPRFFEIWEELNLAWKSRAGKNNLSRLKILIPLVIEKMMIKAADTANAMEARAV